MNDRLRATGELVTWLRAQSEGALDFYCGKDKKARETSQMVELQIARKQLEAADLIERQGKAIEDLELRLHQTNDAHALSCSEHLKALTEIERQGKALRAVAELVQRWRRDIDPANQVDKHEPFYDEGIEDSADELEKTLKAALAQTEPQASSFDGGSPQLSQPTDPLCVCQHPKSQHVEMKSSEAGTEGWTLGCLAEDCACGPGCIHEGFIGAAQTEPQP